MEFMKIKCEIITPLLMHGADGKRAELREQSFKGVMRFWWRAINGNLGLKELKEKEAEIFGDTNKKSSFRM
ncbi:MAG: type III-B CRISPR module RAMP protein Cmr1, partial [Nautiliaceae bacterium]